MAGFVGATRQDSPLAEVTRRLAEAFRPEEIYLFGSRVRGEDHPDSDYDLMVIVPDDAPCSRLGGYACPA